MKVVYNHRMADLDHDIVRIIQEYSPLRNNDERVSYQRMPHWNYYQCDPTCIMHRPVFDSEIECGLELKDGHVRNEIVPLGTKVADAMFRLHHHIQHSHVESLRDSILQYVRLNYVDTISEGQAPFVGYAIAHLCQEHSIDFNAFVVDKVSLSDCINVPLNERDNFKEILSKTMGSKK